MNLEKKLTELQGGKKLVTPEEKQRVKKSFDVARVSESAERDAVSPFLIFALGRMEEEKVHGMHFGVKKEHI